MKLIILTVAFIFIVIVSGSRGSIASPGQFPFMVALLVEKDKSTFMCSSILVDDRQVLTAAHCLNDIDQIKYSLNANPNPADDNDAIYEIVKTKNYTNHPEYNSDLSTNDVALLDLGKSVTFSSFVQPIYLPSKQSIDKTFAGQISTVVSSDGLKKLTISYETARILTNAACRKTYDKIQDTHLCVSQFGSSYSLNGDPGDPLLINENGRLVLVGIASYSGHSIKRGTPRVFTGITKYKDWIESKSNARFS